MPTLEEWREQAGKIEFDLRSVIAGERVASDSDDSIERRSPANGKALYALPVGSARDVDRAVATARKAFDAGYWANMSPMFRKMILMRFADLIDANRGALALLDSMEMGKPISQAEGDLFGTAHIVRYYAEHADRAYGKTAPTAPSLVQYTRREPRGVVAAIVPWNYPAPNAAVKFAPALAAGNSVVLKPSELSPSSALRLSELAVEAGIPPGTFNVVTGTGPQAGAALAAHPDVDFIAFTGSTATGRKLVELSGRSGLKPLQLECGGKSANIVFADCNDIAAVARDAAKRIFENEGQLCVAGTRLIAHESVKEPLVEQVLSCAAALKIGDPLDPATEFGPLASRERKEAVLRSCESALADGAVLRCGGSEVLTSSGGCFVAPTVFDEVSAEMDLAQQDVFGPVLSVFSFSDSRQAVDLANNSRYGLSATVWTRDLGTANAMIRQLKVGRVTVLVAPPDPMAFAFPMGAEPYGQSGFGVEAGSDGFEIYTRLKAVEMHV